MIFFLKLVLGDLKIEGKRAVLEDDVFLPDLATLGRIRTPSGRKSLRTLKVSNMESEL